MKQFTRAWPYADSPRSSALSVLLPLLVFVVTAVGDQQLANELRPRPRWTASRVVGSPDPPPPYMVAPAFTKIPWNHLVFAIREPGSESLIVVEWPVSNEPARALRVLDRPGTEQCTEFLKLDGRMIYSLEFHPNYEHNGQVFVCSKTRAVEGASTNILSRFMVAPPAAGNAAGQPACDPSTEERILEWRSAGHDGGAVVFGHDGMLYVTTGDGSADSDDWLSAQDASNLLGCVLRIDVDNPSPGKPYTIPGDNPLVGVDGARGEIWSLGHRNPWRMAVDAKTGHLWVGNNGQDLWEFAHLIRRGDNCGWSVYEGSHPFYLHRQRGPGELASPTVEHHHSEFRSLTGGVVYYGCVLPDLAGAYIYGDYSTGAIWGVRHDGQQVLWNRELARTTLDIVAFATSHRDELLVIDHTTGIYRLLKSPPDDSHRRFPRTLSATGLFASVNEHRPQAGAIPYTINAPGWSDGAAVERFVALPGDTRIERKSGGSHWEFPNGTVLVQTLSLGTESSGGEGSPRRIETRLLSKQQDEWAAYSYRWNEAQDEATLVPRSGAEVQLSSAVAAHHQGEDVSTTWKIPSRADCMSCHSRAANFVLGLNDLQMDRDHLYHGGRMNQLHVWSAWGMFDEPIIAGSSPQQRCLVDPYNTDHDIELRARSYLHTNCSGCHVTAGGGNSRIQLNIGQELAGMQLVGLPPQHSSLGLEKPLLVAPGEPEQSVLYQRISRRGPAQMPPRGTHVVDRIGSALIHDWILQLSPPREFVKNWRVDDLSDDLSKLQGGRSFPAGETAFRELRCQECHRFADKGGGAGPNLSGVASKRSVRELLESVLEPSKQVDADFATTVVETTGGKLLRGRIVREDERSLVLYAEDALGEPLTVNQSDIDERYLSPTSSMPAGLLDTAEIEEILDLLAYLLADADPDHVYFAE